MGAEYLVKMLAEAGGFRGESDYYESGQGKRMPMTELSRELTK